MSRTRNPSSYADLSGLRKCRKCGVDKPASTEFNRSGKWVHSECRDCRKAYMSRWRQKNPERAKFHNQGKEHRTATLRTYGLTLEAYAQLLDNQGDRCAICFKHVSEFKSRLAVDHCHASGVVRGLLCGNCNRGLGMYADSPDLLTKAASYLKRYKKAG